MKLKKVKKIKVLSPIEQKRKDINDAIKEFSIDDMEVDIINNKTALDWENYAKKIKFARFKLFANSDIVGINSEFVLMLVSTEGKAHNITVMTKNSKTQIKKLPSTREWEQNIKNMARWLLAHPEKVLSSLISNT